MAGADFEARVLSMLTDIQGKISGVSERVARVEVVHVERFGAQGKRLDDIEAEQVAHAADIQALKEHRSFSRGQQAALTAVGTVVGAAAGAAVTHFMGGK